MESKRLRQIKLRHLLAFVETVRCGSLKMAAEQVLLTQPAISKTLKDLERIVGTSLLRRDRGGIALTPEGTVFLQFAEQGLAALNHGLADLDAMRSGTAAPIRVGALPSVAADLLPDVVQEFTRLSPASPVMVEDGTITSLVDGLRAGELDLVVGRMAGPEVMLGLSFTQLYSERVVFAVAADHPLANTKTMEGFEAHCILYPPKQAAIRTLVDRFMIANGVSDWPKKLKTVSGAFGRSMTLGPSQAIWIISEGVVARDIAAGRMVALPIDTRTMAGPIGIFARSEEQPLPALRLFRQLLQDAAQQRLAGRV